MEQRVSLITLGCRDMARAAAFYEALGWQRVESPDGIVVFDLIGQTLGLYPRGLLAEEMGVHPEELGAGAVTLAHNVRSRGDVDAVMVEAEAAGARVLKHPQETFWGGYHGYFADPEGHVWEIAWNPHAPLREKDGAFRWLGW